MKRYSYHFPKFSRMINYGLQIWCATEVDKDGISLGNPSNPSRASSLSWGICHPDCPTHEESLTWRKDETVKMTLQYNNPVLWAGLEMYGILLSCFLLYTLILTALISALGKILRLSTILNHRELRNSEVKSWWMGGDYLRKYILKHITA